MANGNPKPAFYLAVFVVVIALVGLGLWRFGALPGVKKQDVGKEELQQKVESPDTQGITTAKDYTYVPAQKLPAVQGISNYKPMADRTVRFAINVWPAGRRSSLPTMGLKQARRGKLPAEKTSRWNSR